MILRCGFGLKEVGNEWKRYGIVGVGGFEAGIGSCGMVVGMVAVTL